MDDSPEPARPKPGRGPTLAAHRGGANIGWVDTEERLERLERRLHDLEELVLDVRAALPATPQPERPPVSQRSVARPASATPAGHTRSASSAPSTSSAVTPSLVSGRPPSFAASAPIAKSAAATSVATAEEWIGQRGLLAAGVFLLILAAGYFLKLAFDRGWISPLVRCAGGALFGVGVVVTGWRLHQRGLRTYGAAVMGAGAAIVYLAAWAAARLYQLVPVTVGLGSLALVSVGVFALATWIAVEELALVATLGAFMAPLLLGWEGNPDALLVYSAFLAAGLGWFSNRRWRRTTFVIAASFFTLGASVQGGGTPLLMYAVAGSAAGLHIGLQRGWSETRMVAYWAGWILLSWKGASSVLGPAVTVGGVLLAAPIFWHAWKHWCVAPESGDTNVSAETVQFYLTPLWLAWAVSRMAPQWFDLHGGALALLVALPYLIVGYATPRVPFAMVGTTALGIAVMGRWAGVGAVWGLLVLALLLAALDHRLNRRDGRWYGLVWVGAAILHLLTSDLDSRAVRTPAFTDTWALTLWAAIGVVALLAAGLWRREETAPPPEESGAGYRPFVWRDIGVSPASMPATLWAVAGTMLFLGVTGEIPRAVGQAGLPVATARLTGGLAVSGWWAIFATALVVLGFRLGLRSVRLAGLGVAGLAVIKVLVVDLAELDAFYRIGSVFTLALASLGVAYLYHRQARRRRDASREEPVPAVGAGGASVPLSGPRGSG